MEPSSQKLVSVIIPAWNIETYLARTIESVICQTYQNLEIIIVNDGSTDRTLDIIQNYKNKDSRIIVIDQANKGLSGARNAGCSLARGEYICIIDADDLMLPNKIESQVRYMESNPQIDFTYSKVYYFRDDSKEMLLRDLITPEGSTNVYQGLLKHGNFISPNAVLFKKNVFDTYGGFDETLRSSEDLDYWLTLSKKGVMFGHQKERLTLCRIRNNSLTADSVMMYSTVIRVFEKHILSGKSTWRAMICYPQYLKNRFLLMFSFLKRSKATVGKLSGNTVSRANVFSLLFAALRNLKWSLTFKAIKDKKVEDYLNSIESQEPL